MPITPVQTTGGFSLTAVASIPKAFTSSVTAGNTLIVACGPWYLGDLDTCTDSQGNTYTLVQSNLKLRIWKAVAVSTGACTVTVTLVSGTQFMAMGLAELPGSGYVITTITDMVVGSGITHALSGFLPTTESALFVMVTAQGADPMTVTPDAAWTEISSNDNGDDYLAYSWIWRQAIAGSYTATWTTAASIVSYMVGIVVSPGTAAQKKGSTVVGVTTTVTAPRAFAVGLDNNVNVLAEAGKMKVFGNFEVTGTATFRAIVSPTTPLTWSVLVAGSPPELVFADGDVIMVPL